LDVESLTTEQLCATTAAQRPLSILHRLLTLPFFPLSFFPFKFIPVSVAATVIYAYSSLVPLTLWAWFRIYHANNRPNLFDVFCLYGYSLFPYAPVSVRGWGIVSVGDDLHPPHSCCVPSPLSTVAGSGLCSASFMCHHVRQFGGLMYFCILISNPPPSHTQLP
jgi:hypothetical protein